MKPVSNRLLEIDALRAIACSFIVFGHTAEVLSHLANSHSSAKFAHELVWKSGIGNTAVVIFFAISGFGICNSMRGTRIKGSLDFIIRRFFRLYPVFWLSMFIALLFVYLPNNIPITWSTIVANATMLPELLGHHPLIVVYWTLETELAFYFLCLLLFLMRGHNNPYVLTGVMLILFSIFCFFITHRQIAPQHAPWLGMPFHICIAFWGALYRYCEDNGKQPIRFFNSTIQPWVLFYTVTTIILAPAILVFGSYFFNGNYWSIRNSFPYISGILGFLIFTKWLPVRSTMLAELGNYTYAIYLLHHVIITYSISLIYPKYPAFFSYNIMYYFILVSLISIFAGFLVYNTLEKTMMNYSKELVKKL